MSNIKKVKDVSEIVKKLLTKRPELRDNDNALVATVWSMEFPDAIHDTAYNFMVAYGWGELTAADTITRARRMLQNENPMLRGKRWFQRQKKGNDFSKGI